MAGGGSIIYFYQDFFPMPHIKIDLIFLLAFLGGDFLFSSVPLTKPKVPSVNSSLPV